MADQSELRMNLAAIKRVDPYARAIVDSSAHVAFYTFRAEDTTWEKTDVEGAFFIYSRAAEPLYSIFINNRLNTHSLVEPIAGHLELQSQPPFLLYRNERQRIRGFWFYNKDECDRIGVLVDRLIREVENGSGGGVAGVTVAAAGALPAAAVPAAAQANNSSQVVVNNVPPQLQQHKQQQQQQQQQQPIQQQAPKVQAPGNGHALSADNNCATTTKAVPNALHSNANNSGVDIFSMLSKAQEDYNNAKVGGNGANGNAPGSAIKASAAAAAASTTSVHTASLNITTATVQMPANSNSGGSEVASQSVLNFFAAAVPATAQEVPIFQRMLSQPMSVEQLEKQQQLQKNQQQQQQHLQSANVPTIAEKLLGAAAKQKQAEQLSEQVGKRTTPQPHKTGAAVAVDNIQRIENGIGFLHIASPQPQQQHQQQHQQQQRSHLQPDNDNNPSGSSPLATFINNNSNYLANISRPADAEQQRQPQSLHQQPLQQLLRRSESQSNQQQQQQLHNLISGNSNSTSTNTPGKPALMLPTMFTPTASAAASATIAAAITPTTIAPQTVEQRTNSNSNTNDIDLLRLQHLNNNHHRNATNSHVPSSIANAQPLMADTNLQSMKNNAYGNAAAFDPVGKPEPLTQSQLLQAMNYLIRNDPDFVRKLHEAYLKSFTEMVSL